MEATTYYQSEFIIFDCPYCEHKHYLDTSDMYDEGRNIDGKHFKCEKCEKEFYLENY